MCEEVNTNMHWRVMDIMKSVKNLPETQQRKLASFMSEFHEDTIRSHRQTYEMLTMLECRMNPSNQKDPKFTFSALRRELNHWYTESLFDGSKLVKPVVEMKSEDDDS